MYKPARLLAAALFAAALSVSALAAPEGLFRNPSVSKTQIVFEYANDLWTVGREGGVATRLTSGIGREFNPHFSPDGKLVAFSGEYDGNVDVYVIPAEGGVPRRLTYHPGPDDVVGWTPDGKSVLFNSRREAHSDSGRLYTIALVGGTLPKRSRWIAPRTAPTRLTAHTLPICRISSGSRHGSATVAAKP